MGARRTPPLIGMSDDPDMAFQTLRVETSGQIGRLTLDRPDRRNAMSPLMLSELAEAARRFDAQDELKVVVVEGAGPAFCAGFDLTELSAATGSAFAVADLGRQMAEAIGRMRAVTIARLHGHVVGGGLVLAAACDLRIAADDTSFSIPEAEIGIPLAWGGVPRLVREIGPTVTKDLVLSCRAFDAAEARALGFVSRVAPSDLLDGETQALAEALAQRPAFVLSVTKRHVDAVTEAAYPTGGAFADAALTAAAIQDPESMEATARYMAGRAARGKP